MMDSSVNGGAAPTEAKKWKKKSKKSFLQKAKKFGKRGQFGRGKQIEKDTYDYFVRVLEQMKAPFEDEEAKGNIMPLIQLLTGKAQERH